jgi:DNA-directed RNA polymerase specialized sigma24 family protein
MKTLTPEQRAAVVLREVEGLSYEEIAKTLGARDRHRDVPVHYAESAFRHCCGAPRG